MLMLLSARVTRVLFLVRFNNFSEKTDCEGVAPGRGLFTLCSHWAIPFNKGTPPPPWMIFQCLSQGVLIC